MNTQHQPHLSSAPQRRARSVVAASAALAIVLAACGSDAESDSDQAPSATDAPVETEAPTETADTAAPSDTADTDGESATDADAEPDAGADGDAAAASFPVTIEHKFGETTIDAEPQRIVSIGYAEHDGLLAMGVEPVAVRDWYGDQPYGTWPWAQDELGDHQPELLPATELNFEQIAALQPDVIVGINSGMSDADYQTLSAIAPTVAQPGDYVDYGTPWDEGLRIHGAALGTTEEAEQVIADTEAMFAAVREAYPEFEGQTASVAFFFEDQPGAYATEDNRAQTLAEFGFVTPPEYDDLAGDAFYFSVSQEEISTIDTDVIVWIASAATEIEQIRTMPLRPTLTAFAEGREIMADPVLSGAFSHGSPLSIEYVVDNLVPELAIAVDGDPATEVSSFRQLDPDATPVTDDDTADLGAEEQAAADAWIVVFDSTSTFEATAPHLEDAEALAATVASYAEAGSAMGGISLEPTAVTVDGDTASVTYDVYFGENAAYTALAGEMTLVDGVWVVSREEFCSFMASARNSCPASDD